MPIVAQQNQIRAAMSQKRQSRDTANDEDLTKDNSPTHDA